MGYLSKAATGNSSKFCQLKNKCYVNEKWLNFPKGLGQFRNKFVVSIMSDKWEETSWPILMDNTILESKSNLIN